MKTKFILLAESDAEEEELTQRALWKIHINNPLVAVHDGAEALDYLFGTGQYWGRDLRQMPAVVLLDVTLPRTNGWEVLNRIRAESRTRHLPVVLLTDVWEPADLLRGYRLKVEGFVHKSEDVQTYSHALEQMNLERFFSGEPTASKLAA
jgi:CheY-like chemotaxis protein